MVYHRLVQLEMHRTLGALQAVKWQSSLFGHICNGRVYFLDTFAMG